MSFFLNWDYFALGNRDARCDCTRADQGREHG
jgi:hypothetical protein